MSAPEVSSYVAIERAKKTPDTTIRINLINNGWTEKDIAEAMGPQGIPINSDLKAHRETVKWVTFFTLIAIDAFLILLIRVMFGTNGVFGLSLISILVRLLLIYLIAVFSSHGTKIHGSTTKNVFYSVLTVCFSAILFILVSAGVVFAGCMFMLSGGI